MRRHASAPFPGRPWMAMPARDGIHRGKDMRDDGSRRGAVLGALVAVALLGGACEEREGLPEAGSEWEGRPNNAQSVESFGEPPRAEEPAQGGSGTIQEEVPSPRDEPMPQLEVKERFEREGFDAELEGEREAGPGGAIGAQPREDGAPER